jgi:predicted HicB family RNase H-like nuclease
MPRGGARDGAGRKPIGDNSKSCYLNIRISPEDKTKIYELAGRANMSVGEFVIRQCLKEK